MATRNLTMQLKNLDETPNSGARISIRLNRAMPVMDGTILANTLETESDANGRATLSIVPSATGTNYTISITPSGFQPLTFVMPDRDITLTQLISTRLSEEGAETGGVAPSGGTELLLVPSVATQFIPTTTVRMTAPANLVWGPWSEPLRYTNNANGARLVTISGCLNFSPNWSTAVNARAEVVLVFSHRTPAGDKVGPQGAFSDYIAYKEIPHRANMGEVASFPFTFSANLGVSEYILAESRFRSQFPNNAGTVSLVDSPCQVMIYENL